MHQIYFGPKSQRDKLLVWITDLHLDAATFPAKQHFVEQIASFNPDGILIGGDISNGITSLEHLKHFAGFFQKPIYFVLGNHDFYYGSIPNIRNMAHAICKNSPSIHYLTDDGVIRLSESTGLIGHDGWSDGRAGDYFSSPIMLNDYFLIDELKELPPEVRLQKLHELGAEAADYIKEMLPKALKKYNQVILLTHAPPFEEACLYEGIPCDADWSPHFVCQALGEALVEVMQNHPDKHLLTLCGHSHSPADLSVMPNLRVVAGASELGLPSIQGLVHVSMS